MNNKKLIEDISSGQNSFYQDIDFVNVNNNNINNKISNNSFNSKKTIKKQPLGTFNEEYPEGFFDFLYTN